MVIYLIYIMTFCGKGIFFVLIIVEIKFVSCFPQTNFKPYNKGNLPTNTNFISQPSCQTQNKEPIYKKFNFPEMEYSLASNNPFDFPENNKLASLRTKLSSNSYSARNFNLKSNNLEKEFSSAPNYRDFGKFSEVEYPLTANELWKPNYWNCPNSMNTICENQPNINSKLNHTFTRKEFTSNFRKHCLPESVLSFSNKSYSDPKKNYMMLKNKQINNLVRTVNKSNETLLKNKDSMCIKDNYESQKSDKDGSISTYVDKFNNHMISLLKPASGIENLHVETNFSNVCNNNGYFASDHEAKLKRSENIVNSYADKFNDEMSSIIKFVADKIVLSNSKYSEENLLGRKETETHNLNSPKRNIEENSLNIFNPTLDDTENQVKLYADEFNDKITSIIKTTADRCLSQNIELPMVNYNLQSSNKGINDFEPDYETKFELFGDSVNSYTDRLNEKITSVLSAKFNDIFFSNLQCPKEIDDYEKYLLTENSPDLFCQIKQNFTTQEPKLNINYTNLKSDNPLICNENVKHSESRISDKEKILFENSSKGLENEKQKNIDKLKDDTFFSNEEFTTDAYPESDNSGSFYALSTVAPTKSILDSNVIEPEKSLYPDELEQYFMLV